MQSNEIALREKNCDVTDYICKKIAWTQRSQKSFTIGLGNNF